MKNPDGTLVNLSGCSVLAKFKYRQEDSDLEAVPMTCTINLTTSEITISLSKTTTVGLVPGVGAYDIILQNSALELEPLLAVDLDITTSPTLSPPQI